MSFRERGLTVVSELVLPIHYKSAVFDRGYRIDLLVEGEIIVELKSLEKSSVLVTGIKRVANKL